MLIQPVQAEVPPAAMAPEASEKVALFEWGSRYYAVHHQLHEAADAHDIDIALLQALVATESGFDASVVSAQGAVGLMQLMPATARRLGLKGDKRATLQRKLADPGVNLQTGSRYLRYLINLFPGQIELALAAYNAGEGTVKRAGNRVPNLKKTTRDYVQTVMQLYGQLRPVTAELTPRSAPLLPPPPIQSPE
jgi:soluble lytic murein transglycosylase-like protein